MNTACKLQRKPTGTSIIPLRNLWFRVKKTGSVGVAKQLLIDWDAGPKLYVGLYPVGGEGLPEFDYWLLDSDVECLG